ncbi:MAG: CPBP family intramembrane glutamic endopeptidase [Dermatophilaceae bacterium]
MDAMVKIAGLAVAHMAIVAALVAALAFRRTRRPVDWRALLFGGSVYVGYLVIIYIPPSGPFAGQIVNWQNKTIAIVAVVALVWMSPALSFARIGLARPAVGSLRPVAVLFVVMFGLAVVGGLQFGSDVTGEEIAYQFVMPALDEELVYRGVLLVILDRVVDIRWRLGRCELGFGAIATTLLFGLGHGLIVDIDGNLIVSPETFVMTGLLGFALVWVRVRTASLLPAMALHSLWDGTIVSVAAVTNP